MSLSTTTSCWAIEHRRGSLLRNDSAVGYELYSTRGAALLAIELGKLHNAAPVKVNIKIEGAQLWSTKKNTKKKMMSVKSVPSAVGAVKECGKDHLATGAEAEAASQ